MVADAGEEKGHEVVGREVDQVGLIRQSVEVGSDFKFVGFVSILFGLVQNFFLDNLDIKVLRLDVCILTVEAQGDFLVAFWFATVDVINVVE